MSKINSQAEYLTFDDVLLAPRFSTVRSRADVDLSSGDAKLPIIASNMDSVCGPEMAIAMHQAGGLACLHRFWSVDENVSAFTKVLRATKAPWVSVGVGERELDRAKALYRAGACDFIIDVAHGASAAVAEQYVAIKRHLLGSFVVVGNFATARSVADFHAYLRENLKWGQTVDGIKCGVGPGSACTTRIQTGVGVPQLSAILDVVDEFTPRFDPFSQKIQGYQGAKPLIIADGGCKTPGDVAKGLAAGADIVMLGGLLAGTDESPGDVIQAHQALDGRLVGKTKVYRGSASKESYEAQGKDQSYIAPEGEAFHVAYKGPVAKVLNEIAGGLRSSFSYVGATTLKEFQERADFIKVSKAGARESEAHGKK